MLSMLTMPKVQASASETIECLNFLVLHAEFEISYTSQEDGKCLSRNGKIWKSCERSAKRTSNEDTFTVKSQNFSMVL